MPRSGRATPVAPLLNLQGEVVGISTAGIGSGMVGVDPGSADLAFAVEGNTVCRAAAEAVARGGRDRLAVPRYPGRSLR